MVESTAVHGRGSQRGEAATGLQMEQRDSFKTFETVTDAIVKRRVVGTVKLGFALVVEEVRGAAGTKGDAVDSGSEARISESLPSHCASAAASLQASERSLPGLDGCEVPAKPGHAGNPPERAPLLASSLVWRSGDEEMRPVLLPGLSSLIALLRGLAVCSCEPGHRGGTARSVQ